MPEPDSLSPKVSFTCPKCNEPIGVLGIENVSEAEGCTMDCPECGALLICHKGVAKGLHEHIHSTSPEWPIDGAGTGYIEINDT